MDGRHDTAASGFFTRRLESFPRLPVYRLAQQEGVFPYYKTVQSASTPRFTIEGRDRINFGSNNYLGLSYHPRVIEAAERALHTYGAGVTGSRLLNGTLDLHRTFEAELASFYQRPAALVFSTGYVANLSVLAGLLRRHDIAVLDKDAHNSLLAGAQLSAATLKRFRHNDVGQLETILDDLPDDTGKAVVVDGVYSMTGDTAPLDRLVKVCAARPETFLLDDEAHGFGVLGDTGRGAAEQYGVLDDTDLITITFSKSLGSCGGAVVGSAEAIELLTINANPLIFTASNTPASVASALEALRIIRESPELPARLRATVMTFAEMLRSRGVPTNDPEGAIITIPLRAGDEASTAIAAHALYEAGIYVNMVVQPAVPTGHGLIRISLMVDHSPELLEEAADTIERVLRTQQQLP